MDIDRIRLLIAYDQDSGGFTWRCNRRSKFARAGAPAGNMRHDGYVRIGIDGRLHYAHRLAWVLTVGPIPFGMEIDHIDHNPSNNRLNNLRIVTKSGNRKNRSRDSRNKSGVNGVHWSANANAWCAQVRSDSKTEHIGYFKSLNEAEIARRYAEAKFNFHENHGAIK